jgi:aminodeoxyfutalosine deaminase
MPFSLRARVVFPIDSPPIENGVVTIEGERIVAVSTSPLDGEPVRDLGDAALFPGLINAHTHLEFSGLLQPLGEPGMALVDWIPTVLAHRRSRDSTAKMSIPAGCLESLAQGVTTIGEIATADAAAYADLAPVDLVLMIETIGFSRARAESALQAAAQQLNAFDAKFAGAANVQLGLSPHAPYTVSPELLASLIALARKRNLPIAMHVAESVDELELLASGTGRFQQLLDERSMWDDTAIPRGSTPFDYLQLLATAPRALVIHGNHLDRDEHAFLATHSDRMSLVYCPRTHAYFDHPPYPLAQLLNASVCVALGTDSRASNPDLSLLAEIRDVAQRHPEVRPESVLRMGTLAGAQALGREQACGSITPGKLANLFAIPTRAAKTQRAEDVLSEVLLSTTAPSAVWCRGQQVLGPH